MSVAISIRNLSTGLTGPDVSDLQKQLRLAVPAAEQQGSSFGQGTHNTVAQFQAANGLQATGVVDTAADAEKTYLYFNGQPPHSNVYQGQIQPQRGTAPVRIGTRDFNSYFQGDIRGVRVWNRLLTAAEIANLYATDTAPRTGLVAEYLLTQDVAPDTTGNHNGQITAGTWIQGD